MNRPFLSLRSLIRTTTACCLAFLVLLPLLGPAAHAQESDPDEVVIFVLDLSGSMNEPFDSGQTKLDVAKAAFVEVFANVSPDALVGLRTYGDQIEPTSPAGREASCTSDTRLVSPVATLQRDQLIRQVQGFSALGDTPMGLALQEAKGDIPAGATGTIVLFSDGRDECFDADLDGDPGAGPSYGDDPCGIAQTIADDSSNVDQVVTVGFRADSAAEGELRCIAESTGGTYTAIETPEDARDVLPELLLSLSAPREAARLVGREIRGTTTIDNAPDLVRLEEVDANQVLYTDTIDMNSERMYRLSEYGPDGGTFTATVFGLPAEADIAFDLRVWVPDIQERRFTGEFGDFDAGLPARPTASIRCTDCTIDGPAREVFWILSLKTADTSLTGTYELELLTEGPGFGGPPTTCRAPQACFYPQEILENTEALASVQAELDATIAGVAPQDLVDQRDQITGQDGNDQNAIREANEQAEILEERLATAPLKSNSFRVPLLMILGGLLLLFAPLHKLKLERKPKAAADEDEAEEEHGENDDDDAARSVSAVGTDPERAGPSLDVGVAPAISPDRKGAAKPWDAELEAAKEALAQQRPARPTPRPTADDGFTPEQHAEAKAAAERIAAAKAAANESDAPEPPRKKPATPLTAALAAAEERNTELPAAAERAAADQQPAANQAAADHEAAEHAAHEETVGEEAVGEEAVGEEAVGEEAVGEEAAGEEAQSGAEKAAAERAAVEQQEATAVQLAAEQAAAEARASADQATIRAAEQAAAAAATRAEAEQVAAEQAATQASQLTAEKAAAQQAAAEVAARIAAEQAAAEQAAKDAAERAAAEKAAKEAAERAAAEKAAAEQAAKEAAERAAAEKAAAEQAAREAAEQAATEKAAAEQAAREAAEQAAAQRAAREAAERAAAEEAARIAAEQAAAEKAAAEEAARIAAEQAAAERAAAEAAERLAAERAAAEKAAAEAAERLAVEKAAAEKAAAERAVAEQAAREAAEKAAADRAAAEKAAAERAAAEQAAAQATAQREAAELEAAQAAAERAAAEQAAAQASAQREAAELQAAQAAAERAAAEQAAAQDDLTGEQSAPTEEERRQEARRRMLAKQNLVASSSGQQASDPAAKPDLAGTNALVRPKSLDDQVSASQQAEKAEPQAPGWYEDPAIVGQYRWWDGTTWTGHTSPGEEGTPA